MLDVLLGQTALLMGVRDGLGLAGALAGRADLHDAVHIDLEGDLDLGHTTGCRGDGVELELAEVGVVLGRGVWVFALEDS